MRLKRITATPHPTGNRIDLTWVNPDPDRYPGVRVVRREGTYPTSAEKHLLDLDLSFQSDLDNSTLSLALQQEFLRGQVALSDQATIVVELPGRKWRVLDGAQEYVARKNATEINVYDESILVADSFIFSLTLGFRRGLDRNRLSRALRQRFSDHRVALSDQAATIVELLGRKWRITDGIQEYVVRRSRTALNVYDENLLVADQFLFSLALGLQSVAGDGALPLVLRKGFSDHQVSLSDQARIILDLPGRKWRVVDGAQEYTIRKNATALDVYSDLGFAADRNLRGETVYYYALFPHQGDLSEVQLDRHNRAAAMATAPYDVAGQMYDLLPRIYHRYDTALPKPDGVSEEDRQKGQLRRFLDLPGSQLDQLYSFARAALNLYYLDKVDGRLLPLLAQWVGWETDYKQEIDAQRNEIRNAPSIYERIGIIPTVEATVKRILGWESRTKEFVHNVFLSNRPERLNLWASQRGSNGEWEAPTEPLSLDFAYAGRPTAIRDVRDGNETVWLFYHRPRKNQADSPNPWDIWYKTLSRFIIASEFRGDLDQGAVSTGLQRVFAEQGFSLAQRATIESKDGAWQITDVDNGETYTVKEERDRLNVYHWAPSRPLTHRTRLDKHPTAVTLGGTTWVLWESYDEAKRTWRIDYRTRGGDGAWSPIATLADPEAGAQPERRQPCAVVDRADVLWLFWLEKVEARWQLKYNRHDGPDWDEESIRLFPSSAKSFPLDDNGKSVQSDVFAFADPDSRLWLFWARKVKAPNDESDQTEATAGKPNQTRWQIAYRFTAGIDGWSPIYTLPQEPADYDCREPAVVWNETEGTIELFWSSNRDGSWSIWHGTLDTTTHECGMAERITDNPYSQRDPLPISLSAGTLLVYRSNESLTYASAVYGATETFDARYAGCTTVDTRNLPKIALQGQYEDFQTYTYDTGQNGVPTNQDWYARDTVGIYLASDIEDPTLIVRNQNLIENVLRQFLPIQVRTVFVIEPFGYQELVYTDDLPIGERVFDSTIPETYLGLGDDHAKGIVPGWVLMRAWGDEHPEPEHFRASVDFAEPPVDTRFRTWHADLELEDEPWT